MTSTSTHRRIQVDKDGSRYVFAIASLGEEGLEGTRLTNIFGIGVRTTIRLEAVLKKVSGG